MPSNYDPRLARISALFLFGRTAALLGYGAFLIWVMTIVGEAVR